MFSVDDHGGHSPFLFYGSISPVGLQLPDNRLLSVRYKCPVDTVLLHQFMMLALLYDFTAVNDDDLIGVLDGFKSVCDHEDDVCNDPHNKAELTPFVDMFLSIVEISMQQLLETLTEKKQKWDYYCKRINNLPNTDKQDMPLLYDLLMGVMKQIVLNALASAADAVSERRLLSMTSVRKSLLGANSLREEQRLQF